MGPDYRQKGRFVMKKTSFKRLGALAMSLIMCFALAVSASAKSGTNVTIYKENGTDISMADDIVAGNATISVDGDTTTVVIPIQPIVGYAPMSFLPKADGYLRSLTVTGASSAVVSPDSGFDTSATLTIVMPTDSMPSDGRFAVTTSHIDLYKTGTTDAYTFVDHVSPSFIIAIG